MATSEVADPVRPAIVQVLHSLDCGGTEKLAVRLAKRLAKRYSVAMALLDGGGALMAEVDQERIACSILERKPGLDWRCSQRLRQIWKTYSPGVVIAQQYTPFFYSALTRWLYGRVPIVYIEHGRFYPDRRKLRRILYNRFVLKPYDHIVAVGEAVRRALIINEGFPKHRIRIIYNGVDLKRFSAQRTNRESIRHSLNVTASQVLVLQVARFDPLKDHFTAVRAFELLGAKSIKLVLVGDGPTKNEIDSYIRKKGLEGIVHTLGYREDIPDLLAASDIFLLTSLNEGIPVTIIEAMAAGLPVVATNVGGIPELVIDGETGILVPPQDPAAVASGVLRLATDHDLCRRFGAAGQERAHRFFSEDRMLREYESVVENALSNCCAG